MLAGSRNTAGPEWVRTHHQGDLRIERLSSGEPPAGVHLNSNLVSPRLPWAKPLEATVFNNLARGCVQEVMSVTHTHYWLLGAPIRKSVTMWKQIFHGYFLATLKNKWCMLMMMKYTWWDKFPPVYANKFFVDVLYASIYYSEVQTCRQIHVSVRTLKHLHSKTASFIINPYHRWTPSEADCRLETLFITAEMAFPTSVLQLNSPHCSHRASLPF